MTGKKNDFRVTPIEEEDPEAFGMQPSPLSDNSRGEDDVPMMRVREVEDDIDEDDLDEDVVDPIQPSDLRAVDGASVGGSGKIAIAFDKFVQLLTAHDFENAMKGHHKKEIIIDIDLLADLATPQEEEEQRRVPMMFALGLFVGGVVVFVLVKLLT